MQLLRKAVAIFDRTLTSLYVLATILFILISLAILVEVGMRTFGGPPIIGLIEVTGYVLVYVTFLAAAWLLREEGHVNIDVILSRLKPRTQARLNIITSIIGAIICLVVTWYGAKVTWYVYQTNYRSIAELEIPLLPIVVIVPVGSFLLTIQFLRRAYRYLQARPS